MSLRLTLAALHVPDALRRQGLQELLVRTARAFEVAPPEIAGLPFQEALRSYARFTRQQADRAARLPDGAARVRERLRREAWEFGAGFRERLGVTSRAEALRAARVLYRMLGMDLRASESGSIVVRSCLFSSFYSCDTCAIMSAMDEGLFAGLAGAGHLDFTMRITEGARACVAFYTFEGGAPEGRG